MGARRTAVVVVFLLFFFWWSRQIILSVVVSLVQDAVAVIWGTIVRILCFRDFAFTVFIRKVVVSLIWSIVCVERSSHLLVW